METSICSKSSRNEISSCTGEQLRRALLTAVPLSPFPQRLRIRLLRAHDKDRRLPQGRSARQNPVSP